MCNRVNFTIKCYILSLFTLPRTLFVHSFSLSVFVIHTGGIFRQRFSFQTAIRIDELWSKFYFDVNNIVEHGENRN